MNKWKVIKESVDYQNPYLSVIKEELKHQNGQTTDYFMLARTDFAVSVPIIGQHFVMVSQYRFPLKRQSLEFPMGSNEQREDHLDCAKRELHEEAGYLANDFIYLGEVAVTPGHSGQFFKAYLATGLKKTITKNRDLLEEGMTAHLIKIADFPKLVKEGTIIDGPTLAAYALYQIHKSKVESS